MTHIALEEFNLLVKSLTNILRKLLQGTADLQSVLKPHDPFDSREARSSSTVSKGPYTLPSSTSFKLACSHFGSFLALLFGFATAREMGSTSARTSRTSRSTSVSSLSVLFRTTVAMKDSITREWVKYK